MGNNGTKDVKIMMPLKYLSNFWRTRELNWSASSFKKHAPVNNQIPTFATTDAKIYVSVETLSTQDNAKLLQQ